jgi:hypothetical protein
MAKSFSIGDLRVDHAIVEGLIYEDLKKVYIRSSYSLGGRTPNGSSLYKRTAGKWGFHV